MSEVYKNIPPERRDLYLANAEAAFNDAASPLVERATQDLGRSVVAQAEGLARRHAEAIEQVHKDADDLARASGIGDEAEAYARKHDMSAELQKELAPSDALSRFENLEAAGSMKANPPRGDINPPAIKDLNINTGLGSVMEAAQAQDTDVAVQNQATPVPNRQRPDLPGNSFSQTMGRIGNGSSDSR